MLSRYKVGMPYGPHADAAKRSMIYELNEVALDGLGMAAESYTRLSVVQANLMRLFADMP